MLPSTTPAPGGEAQILKDNIDKHNKSLVKKLMRTTESQAFASSWIFSEDVSCCFSWMTSQIKALIGQNHSDGINRSISRFLFPMQYFYKERRNYEIISSGLS